MGISKRGGGGRTSGGSHGRRRDGARGRSSGHVSSSSFSSSTGSSTDHYDVAGVAGKRQVTPSLVDVASSAERWSKRSVTEDRDKSVSTTSARASASVMATVDAAADARHQAAARRAYNMMTADSWLDHASNCRPLEEHHCAEIFDVSAWLMTDHPSFWGSLLSPSAHAAAFRENQSHCLYCHEDNQSFKHCRHPFINASGCLNPELGQLVEYDAYRRWQARMTSHRRDGEYNRAYNHKENSRHRSGQSRGYHREQGQIISPNSNPGNLYTSGHHGGVPPSPASSAPALVPGMSCGVAYNPI